MLLVVIAALGIGLVVEHQRAARREAELQAQLAKLVNINMPIQFSNGVLE
jgi:hypothetical protein